jgi:hypothetical protein
MVYVRLGASRSRQGALGSDRGRRQGRASGDGEAEGVGVVRSVLAGVAADLGQRSAPGRRFDRQVLQRGWCGHPLSCLSGRLLHETDNASGPVSTIWILRRMLVHKTPLRGGGGGVVCGVAVAEGGGGHRRAVLEDAASEREGAAVLAQERSWGWARADRFAGPNNTILCTPGETQVCKDFYFSYTSKTFDAVISLRPARLAKLVSSG